MLARNAVAMHCPHVARNAVRPCSCVCRGHPTMWRRLVGSASVQASEDAEACGSPGEVANVPSHQNRYNIYHSMGLSRARDNPGDGYPVDLAPFVPEELGVRKDDLRNMKRVEDYNRDRTKRVHAQLQQGKNIACAPLPAPIA